MSNLKIVDFSHNFITTAGLEMILNWLTDFSRIKVSRQSGLDDACVPLRIDLRYNMVL
jgi:hypothetical protein